jgi:hypothetical protein
MKIVVVAAVAVAALASGFAAEASVISIGPTAGRFVLDRATDGDYVVGGASAVRPRRQRR